MSSKRWNLDTDASLTNGINDNGLDNILTDDNKLKQQIDEVSCFFIVVVVELFIHV